ncbi:MAG: Nif3-like dinuclear metal center hexameric protein [Clostridia bacterium]|nr:Nif3-like dinuclear metal center hexameric protein [Clostridia bacterium]
MKVKDIVEKIDWYYPWLTACDFDNVGLLVGDAEADVKKAVVALDCTHEVLDFAISEGATAVVTHHPVIFDGVKKVTAESVVHKAIKHGISIISAHTNYDTGTNGVNEILCQKLGISINKRLMIDGLLIPGGTFAKNLSAKELALKCRDSLFATHIAYADGGKPINKVVVCSGGGGSMLREVMASGADAYITGEAKHSDFVAAKNAGFTLMVCGHFETEDIAVAPLAALLKREVPGVEFIECHKSPVNHI